tara:strand:+ start:403 stop:630 length:228 start_codon:yes stop_codon:yes gene_type:complete
MKNIRFGMPELLVTISLFLYSQSFWFSIISFSLGVMARFMEYILNWSLEQKKAEAINNELTGAAETLRNIFKTEV